MSNRSITLTPYKGARDFYPEDMKSLEYWKDTLSRTVTQFGYEPYDGPMLELASLYQAKTSEEIVNEQTYSFVDRGKRHVVIRPEMTPTFARMVAAKSGALVYPLRWYSIPNLWRYERPQKGRLREHWQFNCDLVASQLSVAYELEMIRLLYAIMTAFGAKDEDYHLKLNHRGLCEVLFERHFNLSQADQRATIFYLIDRLDKMSFEALTQMAQDKGVGRVFDDVFHHVQASKDPTTFFKAIADDPAYESFVSFFDLAASIGSCVQFNPSVVRGFQYYTGLVFEMCDTDPNNPRALLGGGRYDHLISAFSSQKLQGIGFGLGDVTFRAFLEGHGLVNRPQSQTLWGLLASEEATSYAARVQDCFIGHGKLTTSVHVSDRLLFKSGLKTLLKYKPQMLIIVGKQEQDQETVVVKNTATRKEKTITFKDLASFLTKSSLETGLFP